MDVDALSQKTMVVKGCLNSLPLFIREFAGGWCVASEMICDELEPGIAERLNGTAFSFNRLEAVEVLTKLLLAYHVWAVRGSSIPQTMNAKEICDHATLIADLLLAEDK